MDQTMIRQNILLFERIFERESPLPSRVRVRGRNERWSPSFSFLSRQRLCRNHENAVFVILNEVKNLMHSIRYTTQILRLPPQDDIETQSLKGEDVNDFTAGKKCINAPASRGH